MSYLICQSANATLPEMCLNIYFSRRSLESILEYAAISWLSFNLKPIQVLHVSIEYCSFKLFYLCNKKLFIVSLIILKHHS